MFTTKAFSNSRTPRAGCVPSWPCTTPTRELLDLIHNTDGTMVNLCKTKESTDLAQCNKDNRHRIQRKAKQVAACKLLCWNMLGTFIDPLLVVKEVMSSESAMKKICQSHTVTFV